MIWFIVGFFVGGVFGIIFISIFAVGGREDDLMEGYRQGFIAGRAKGENEKKKKGEERDGQTMDHRGR